jgi:phosphate starvation-inducible PhoH-like protein
VPITAINGSAVRSSIAGASDNHWNDCYRTPSFSTIACNQATIGSAGNEDQQKEAIRIPSLGSGREASIRGINIAVSKSVVNLNITLEHPEKKLALFGSADRHLRLIRDTFGVQITSRDDEMRVSGEPEQVSRAAAVLDQLQKKLRRQDWLSIDDVGQAIGRAVEQQRERSPDEIDVYVKGQAVRAKTEGQKRYVEAMTQNDLTFCIGPAGTGKTYLAVAAAASLLKHGQVRRIVLARPAVEAGERLGFLPGDLQAKVNPYLRPLFDALHDMMDFEQVKRFMVNDVIEVIPLAFMRGRTLNDSVIILDEAQNTTPSQMLMFLTRLGHDSKMIVTGDISQVDLPEDVRSGLVDAVERLRGIKGIAQVELERGDIVRHRLVQNIVDAYDPQDTSGDRRTGLSRREAGK